MIDLFHMTLPLILVLTALAIGRVDDLFSAILLASLFSLVIVALFVSLEAVDVALTEAVVGTGVATVLFLCCLARTTSHRARPQSGRFRHSFPIWLSCLACAGLLVYGGWGMPLLGDADAVVHNYINPYYLNRTMADIGIDNVVTSVLASYRGYDTMGELTVIFTAGAGVIMLIGRGHGSGQASPVDEE